MTVNKDQEYIKELFSRDGLETPESLSEDAVRAMLGNAPEADAPAGKPALPDAAPNAGVPAGNPALPEADAPVPLRPRKRRRRIITAIAACCALALISVPAVRHFTASPDMPSLSAGSDGLHHFTDARELDKVMKNLTASRDDMMLKEDGIVMDAMDAESAEESFNASAPAESAMAGDSGTTGSVPGAAGESGSSGGAAKHSETYTQVDGVDEADIVKTDGRYIYYVSGLENQVLIARAENGKASRISSAGGGNAISYIRDLYIKGDQLIVIGTAASEDPEKLSSGATCVLLYDISDRKQPKETGRYTQSGELLSSRLFGSSLCLVTNDYRYTFRRGDSLPYLSYGSGSMDKMDVEDISCFPEPSTPSYTIVGMMDITTGKASGKTVRTKAVLGGSDEIYCNGQNLYITSPVIGSDDATITQGGRTYAFGDPRVRILKVSLKNGKAKYVSTATVAGRLNNQFSMDESGGYFRIATTSIADGRDVNNLFILDENMKETGRVSGFARNEHIEAVRFIKDKAYVITYEQTDPLFIIDLSDPSNPVIEGHVKISGFSTLLVPAGENHLLGLGFSTESTEFGEATDGVKLALFDISDPSVPKVAASESFPGMYSAVQYDHKALTAIPGALRFAIPYETAGSTPETDVIIEDSGDTIIEDSEESSVRPPSEPEVPDAPTRGNGILVFSAEDGTLKVLQDLPTECSVNRCVCIGGYIYGICSDDSIEGFLMK